MRTVETVTGWVRTVVVGRRGWTRGRVLVTSPHSVTVFTWGSTSVVVKAELPWSSLMVVVRKSVSVFTTGELTVTTLGARRSR